MEPKFLKICFIILLTLCILCLQCLDDPELNELDLTESAAKDYLIKYLPSKYIIRIPASLESKESSNKNKISNLNSLFNPKTNKTRRIEKVTFDFENILNYKDLIATIEFFKNIVVRLKSRYSNIVIHFMFVDQAFSEISKYCAGINPCSLTNKKLRVTFDAKMYNTLISILGNNLSESNISLLKNNIDSQTTLYVNTFKTLTDDSGYDFQISLDLPEIPNSEQLIFKWSKDKSRVYIYDLSDASYVLVYDNIQQLLSVKIMAQEANIHHNIVLNLQKISGKGDVNGIIFNAILNNKSMIDLSDSELGTIDFTLDFRGLADNNGAYIDYTGYVKVVKLPIVLSTNQWGFDTVNAGYLEGDFTVFGSIELNSSSTGIASQFKFNIEDAWTKTGNFGIYKQSFLKEFEQGLIDDYKVFISGAVADEFIILPSSIKVDSNTLWSTINRHIIGYGHRINQNEEPNYAIEYWGSIFQISNNQVKVYDVSYSYLDAVELEKFAATSVIVNY